MDNPFATLDARLTNIESLLLDLKHGQPKQVLPPPKRIVDLDGLLKARPYIGSKGTVYKKVSKGLIPHSKNGKRLIFDLQVIDEWLLANRTKTAAEIEREAEQYFNAKN